MAQHFAEWIAGLGPGMANHLWQSTAFAAGAWLVTLALRQNQARVRHAVWLAASIKFLVPFSLLIVVGNLLPHPKQAVAPVVYSAMDVVEEPFAEMAPQFMAPAVHTPTMRERMEAQAPAVLGALWAIGAGVVLIVWASRWRAVSRVLRKAEVVREGREWEILRRLEGESSTSADMKSRSLDSARADPFDSASPRSGQAARASLGMTVHGVHRFRALKGAATPPTQAELGWGTRRDGWAIELRLSTERMEPGIFGVWRPVLVWPRELSARLDDEHIEAIVAHELAHVRRRDNLTAALHMLVETVFWFHPVVWWMERQMVKEREQACDEAVVTMGGDAEAYAESLLKTCRFCIESPLACVAGVTGADLKHRVVEIVTGRAVLRLSWPKKLLLVAAGACVVVAPVVLGQAKAAQRLMLAAVKAAPKPVQTAAHAMLAEKATLAKGEMAEALQAAAPAPNTSTTADVGASKAQPFDFDAVSIRPSDPNGGPGPMVFAAQPDGFISLNMPLNTMLSLLYGSELQRDASRIDGGPDWVRTSSWIIRAKIAQADVAEWSRLVRDPSPAASSRRDATIQAMLVSRFKLKMHFETREGTVYALVVAKGGLKMQESAPDERGEISARGSLFTFQKASMSTILTTIAQRVGSPVVDKTGLTGNYDFTLDSTPLRGAPPASADGSAPLDAPPSIFNVVEEQLGLKLVAQKGPITHLVIDSAERPSVDGAEVVPAAMAVPAASGSDAKAEEVLLPGAVYDVATFKHGDPNAHSSGGGSNSNGTLIWTNMPLKGVICNAYDLPGYRCQDGPGWLQSERYDIEAKPDGATSEQLLKLSRKKSRPVQLRMQQALLADRLKLKVHFESREMTILALVIAKGGLKIHEATPGDTYPNGVKGPDGKPFGRAGAGTFGNGYMTVQGRGLSDLVGNLPGVTGYPIEDRTGLTGIYDFTLHYSPIEPPAPDSTEPSIYTALEQQLGLKLEPIKGPVDVLVIDHVEMPTEN